MKILLFLLLTTLPFQLGKHFWPSFSYVLGLKIDYLSPTLYLQDIFIFFLLAFFFRKSLMRRKILGLQGDSLLVIICLYLLPAFVNIYFSINIFVSVFQWLRITELLILAIIIGKNKEFVWKSLSKIIPFWLIGEFVLSVLQVFRQSSVSGFFWLLGEREFNIFTPGIAKASWLGQVFLRPYGTFSHPNSLSGFILVCLILLFTKEKLSLFGKIAALLGFSLIILCFSRAVWLSVLVLSFFYLLRQLKKGLKEKLSLNFIYIFIIAALLTTVFLFPKTAIEKNSFDYRQKLMNFSFEIIKANPLFGVGANAFIVKLSQNEDVWQLLSFLQPVHNIFLLTASEFGLMGLIIFITFLVVAFKKSFSTPYNLQPITFALSAILFTGLFDHYWLTLVQNQLLFTVVLGLSLF